MIDKKQFAKFCCSLNKWQKRIFIEILDCDIDEVLKGNEANETRDDMCGLNLFLDLFEIDDISKKTTKEIYDQYFDFCETNDFMPVNKIYFSKAIKQRFPVDIIDKKIKGVKYRVFVVKEGVGV